MQLLSRELVMEKLKEVQDPELMMSIVDLGLIYDVAIEDGRVRVLYTLTSPVLRFLRSDPQAWRLVGQAQRPHA